ncbi:MAG: hypothetical protein M1823_005129 [Watsoniomyces obsoletus]|nr:MAG: hypothetical protein M1823_005129 [Watsoniomyces obsoletus]
MRTLQTSACRLGLKESWDKEGIEKDIDHHKHDQLQKAKEGKNHWKEELASESETAVKADRNEATSLDEDISNLQQKTVEKVKKDHPRDRM